MSNLLYIIPMAIIIWFILYKLRQTKLNESSLPNLDLDETVQVYEAKYHEEELRNQIKVLYEERNIHLETLSRKDAWQMLNMNYMAEKNKYWRRHRRDNVHHYKHNGIAKVSSFTSAEYDLMLHNLIDKILDELTNNQTN
ncbi:hypothetical protein [Pedobacter borealis]|uniref:hypothetical protein n=1 Tax=Pedobacter borealis TaxID=475254 RepID=UPI000493AD32|nr:hypothetical protein [Pedobacter borealis]